jgi:hypothetical protein
MSAHVGADTTCDPSMHVWCWGGDGDWTETAGHVTYPSRSQVIELAVQLARPIRGHCCGVDPAEPPAPPGHHHAGPRLHHARRLRSRLVPSDHLGPSAGGPIARAVMVGWFGVSASLSLGRWL